MFMTEFSLTKNSNKASVEVSVSLSDFYFLSPNSMIDRELKFTNA